MDFSLILQSLWSLWYVLPFFLFAAIIQSRWFKGVLGEFIINILARWKLDKMVYHLIKNVTLPTQNGTTQIDHIIVSVYGVFVVETKNLRGWIYGSERQRMWTQKIYKHTHQFQNPLHQNYKHTKTLQSLLGLDDTQVHSLVVFIGNSEFKTPMPDNVTYGMGYIRFILNRTETVLSRAQVIDIKQTIEQGRLARTLKTHREHIKHVQTIVNTKNPTKPCPKCGGTLVLRETKKGINKGQRFWGCASFPQCRVRIPASEYQP
ncbi:Zn-finger domain-containing protein (topoisomerase type I-like) [Methylophaga frappieri]|uniref:Zn-finger domain-containing protein (Topoisomerase type I-like) n=1 Tax=Methylophaga frappieri (strain ATCC BAA-2434 / DSM 25690 / JAM7) TaxID=754477 RepID=I1YLC2_METFJ|nr:NERD domain-containing protein [Methylophaga frappieri]AFJ03715.1 Zn-finger domain-containing protein (topoisomerase type I-like) [Methylophaga frappieri]